MYNRKFVRGKRIIINHSLLTEDSYKIPQNPYARISIAAKPNETSLGNNQTGLRSNNEFFQRKKRLRAIDDQIHKIQVKIS